MSIFKKTIYNPNNIETLEIDYCECTESPREWDNLGTIVSTQSHRHLADKTMDKYELWDLWENKDELNAEYAVVLPVYIYDHSGIALSTKPFGCQFDSGQIGFIGATHERMKEFGVDSVDRVKVILTEEIAELSAWANGEVYRYDYTKTDHNGNELESESCGGYYAIADMQIEPRLMEIVKKELNGFEYYALEK